MTTRKKRDRDFKLEVLRQIERRPLSEVCREYEIHPSTVHRWKNEQQMYPKDAFKGQVNKYKLEAQLAEKDRLIGQLYSENALLKKAIFSLQERQAEERMLRSIK